MNLNVYLTGGEQAKASKKLHRIRNSIVNEAVKEWHNNHDYSPWPKDFFDFDPIADVPDFKELRKNLTPNVRADPL